MMQAYLNYVKSCFVMAICLLGLLTVSSVYACTRILVGDGSNTVMVGRTMDWSKQGMNTNLIVYPQGMVRDGKVAANPMKWVSKYGSIVATAYEDISSDGLNEKGFAAHLLWLDESNYGLRKETLAGISVDKWAQFYLDNFQTVAEAVKYTKTMPFQLVAFYHEATKGWINVHLALEDASGDSAIIEYVNGKATIYHNKAYTVLTNSPTYDEQLKNVKPAYVLNDDYPLPGTTNSVDRFIRASFYANRLSASSPYKEQMTHLVSIINNVSEPYGVSSRERKSVSPTIWRLISDLSHRVYYFQSSTSLNMIFAPLDKFSLQAGSPVMKLDLGLNPDLSGDVTNKFKISAA